MTALYSGLVVVFVTAISVRFYGEQSYVFIYFFLMENVQQPPIKSVLNGSKEN